MLPIFPALFGKNPLNNKEIIKFHLRFKQNFSIKLSHIIIDIRSNTLKLYTKHRIHSIQLKWKFYRRYTHTPRILNKKSQLKKKTQ